MSYQVIIAYSAQEQFRALDARQRSMLKSAMHEYLETSPMTESKSRIKRLRGLRRPQYRLRVGEMRVFYDVDEAIERVEVFAFALKAANSGWLQDHGVAE